ncbi:DUF4905 domain-containing protein [Pontibacter pudoricolor]|uniref:DUF4905 domain-containing protein n=1 Tax=Pontibacter pudoricolor TaxID=2694930 RepID=UPI0013910875|nr:DUF4905 domain-containing protein [Pontibacter pudoricolor]
MVEYNKKLRVILPLVYTYDFGAPVWRMRLDSAANRLAFELRDADLLLADFYSLDLDQHKLEKLPMPAAKNWWLGLEDAHEGLLFIHGYGDRQIGQHKGIFAYDAATTNLQWQQPELAFYGVTKDGVLALDLQDQNLKLLQFKTGTIVAENVSLDSGANAVADYNTVKSQACTYPMLYLEGESYYNEVCNFLEHKLNVKPVKGIEYAETGQNFYTGFYTENAHGNLDNTLCVFNLDGELQLQQCIAAGLSGIGSDTFIIFNHKLYFIRQRNILVVYSLT